MNFHDDNLHKPTCTCQAPISLSSNFWCTLWRKLQSLFWLDSCCEIPEPRHTCLATKFTSTAFVANCFLAQSLPPPLNGGDEILPPVSITSCDFFHTPPSQPHALPLSYRGILSATIESRHKTAGFRGAFSATQLSRNGMLTKQPGLHLRVE